MEEVLFILKTDEEDAKVFIHGNTYDSVDELERYRIDEDKSLIAMPIIRDRKAINIDTNYNSIYAFVSKYIGTIKTYKNTINVLDKHGALIDKGSHSSLPEDKELQVIADSRCHIIHLKDGQVHRRYKITNSRGVSIDYISFGDEIVAIDGLRHNSLIKYIERRRSSADVFDDDLLYMTLCKLDDPFMPPPVWLKKFLLYLKEKPKTASIVRQFLVSNKMPIAADRILKEIYINGGGC